jgi:hypothetical protein
VRTYNIAIYFCLIVKSYHNIPNLGITISWTGLKQVQGSEERQKCGKIPNGSQRERHYKDVISRVANPSEVEGSVQYNATSSPEVLAGSNKWQCNWVTSLDAAAALLMVFMHGGMLVAFALVGVAVRLLIVLILRYCCCCCSWLCHAAHRETGSVLLSNWISISCCFCLVTFWFVLLFFFCDVGSFIRYLRLDV